MEYELLKIGDIAPDFSLPDYEGNLYSLSDFNNNIIMWFFPKANTPGWIIEGKGFRDEFQKFKDKEYSIVGVSADSPAKQKKFVEKFNFPFLMLCDESHDMLKAYKAWALKKFMGREYMGILRITYVINKKGYIEKIFDKVKTKSHASDVLCDI